MSYPHLVSHRVVFDGVRPWMRLEFSTDVHTDRLPGDRGNSDFVENPSPGRHLAWGELPRPAGEQFQRVVTAFKQNEQYELSLPVKLFSLRLTDGARLSREIPFLGLHGADGTEVEIRLWKVRAQHLSLLRPDGGDPFRQAKPIFEPRSEFSQVLSPEPDWSIRHHGSATNDEVDITSVVAERPGLLYAELWSGDQWHDARWLDGSGLGARLSTGAHREGGYFLTVWDLESGYPVEGSFDGETTPGVFSLPSSALKRVEILGQSWIVIQGQGWETCLPDLKDRRSERPLDRLVVFTDRRIYRQGEAVVYSGWYRSRDPVTGEWCQHETGALDSALSYRIWGRPDRLGVRTTLEPTRWDGFMGRYTIDAEDKEAASLEVAATDFEGDKASAQAQASQGNVDYPECGCDLRFVGDQIRLQVSYATGEPLAGLEVHLAIRGVFEPAFPRMNHYQFLHQRHPDYPVEPEYQNPSPPRLERSERLTTGEDGSATLTFDRQTPPGGHSATWTASASAVLPDGLRAQVGAVQNVGAAEVPRVGLKMWGDQVFVVVCDGRGRLLKEGALEVWTGGGFRRTHSLSGENLQFPWPQQAPGRLYARASGPDGRSSLITSLVHLPVPGRLRARAFPLTLIVDLESRIYREEESLEFVAFQDGGPALMVVSIYNHQLVAQESRRIETGESHWQFPLDKRFVGTNALRVELNTAHGHSVWSRNFEVDAERYRLSVEVECRPGQVSQKEPFQVEVLVRDSHGEPTKNADVMLYVVDEGALQQGGDGLSNPLERFYHNNPPNLAESYGVCSSVHHTFQKPESDRVFSQASWNSETPESNLPAFREPGDPLIYAGRHQTDAEGKLCVQAVMTGLPGRYTVVAQVAHAYTRFGQGRTTVIGRQPLLTLRAACPGHLWVGDTWHLPVRVVNPSPDRQSGRLLSRSSGLQAAASEDLIEVDSQKSAVCTKTFVALEEGVGVVQLRLQTQEGNDALQIKVPIYEMEYTRPWSLTGFLGREPLQVPLGSYSSLQLEVWHQDPRKAVFDSLGGRNDPLSAARRILAWYWVGDYRAYFESLGSQKSRSLPPVEYSLLQVLGAQTTQGNFGESEDFYTTLFITRALSAAASAGADVPSEALEKARGFLLAHFQDEIERSNGTIPCPWEPIDDVFLAELGLPTKGSHGLEKSALSPMGALGFEPIGTPTPGGWPADPFEDPQQKLSRFAPLVTHFRDTPLAEPHGVFQFGSSERCLGRWRCEGEGRGARWQLPVGLPELHLEFQGKGNLAYRLSGTLLEERAPGYGLASILLNRKPPDEDGAWRLKVGDSVSLEVIYAMDRPGALRCFLPRPATLEGKSDCHVLYQDGSGHFQFYGLSVRHRGTFVFPPAQVEDLRGVISRTDWHRLIVE